VLTASKYDSEGPTFSFQLGPNFPATFFVFMQNVQMPYRYTMV